MRRVPVPDASTQSLQQPQHLESCATSTCKLSLFMHFLFARTTFCSPAYFNGKRPCGLLHATLPKREENFHFLSLLIHYKYLYLCRTLLETPFRAHTTACRPCPPSPIPKRQTTLQENDIKCTRHTHHINQADKQTD